MSATVLRDQVRDDLQKQVREHVGYLADRTSDTLDQLRLNQGRIEGLRIALDLLNQRYRDLNS
jgi:hypothetical protein